MSNPTFEQKEAITKSGKNIIVSAGAGSGKTFVLKERVLNKIKNNINVNQLIILTFTNNAAGEMKDRIRKIINSHPEVKDQANLLDSAYITTFDSFAQSLVKKYNYLLNINKDFTIIDTNIVDMELNRILEQIFMNYYASNNPLFNELIDNYCYKNDTELKKCIINIYHSLLNVIDRTSLLNNYLETYFEKEKIDELIEDYNKIIFQKIDELIPLYSDLLDHTIDDKALEKNKQKFLAISCIKNKDDIEDTLSLSIARNGKKIVYDDDAQEVKNKISSIEKEVKELIRYDDCELIEQYLQTKNSVSIVIDILKELDKRILEFKNEHNSYEFADIAFKAIELVKNYPDVCEEIKNNTKEIMIDEYQDTNDIQEEFISYIQNNNVYMVGDVKQSIYRFRNANPYIFKTKYDDYKNGINGYKIDLTNNFRSRKEVINNINSLFSSIMFDQIGGADYKKEHQMNFGKQEYENKKMKDYDYDMKILNYTNSKYSLYDQAEIESFIIAKDIINKMNNNISIMDSNDELKPLQYGDFCILIDKSKNFDKVKKILEYFHIPATIYKDISIQKDDEVFILKNLITLLIHIKEHNYNAQFKHAYMSIGRSYIYKINDNELFDIFQNNSFEDTDLFKKLSNLVKELDSLSNKEILYKLIDDFDFFEKIITVGDIKERSSKLEYFTNQANDLNKFGLDIYSLETYFNQIIESDNELKMGGKNSSKNSVKIMTIHASKGLEFPFVYLPFLNSSFKSRKKNRIRFSSKYGFILPYNDGKIEDTFINTLDNNTELIENISEKIRLLYVAITRAREQFIMINQFNDKIDPVNHIFSSNLLICNSYQDILSMLKNSISKYVVNIDINSLNLTKEYTIIEDSNYNSLITNNDKIINIKELDLTNKIMVSKHFSKPLSKIMDKEFKSRLDYGTRMHYIFEVYDFKNNNNNLDITDEEKKEIEVFLSNDLVKNIKNAKIYKEHEIMYKDNESAYHGFIDLLLEYSDHFDIIDYKLSNVDSKEYALQLNGYRKYIENKYNKPTNMYLYSIKKHIFKKIDRDDE